MRRKSSVVVVFIVILLGPAGSLVLRQANQSDSDGALDKSDATKLSLSTQTDNFVVGQNDAVKSESHAKPKLQAEDPTKSDKTGYLPNSASAKNNEESAPIGGEKDSAAPSGPEYDHGAEKPVHPDTHVTSATTEPLVKTVPVATSTPVASKSPGQATGIASVKATLDGGTNDAGTSDAAIEDTKKENGQHSNNIAQKPFLTEDGDLDDYALETDSNQNGAVEQTKPSSQAEDQAKQKPVDDSVAVGQLGGQSGGQGQPEVPVIPQYRTPEPAASSHFLSYFITVAVLVAVVYILFHNRQKLMGLIVEGRSGRAGGRRSNINYRRLDNGLDPSDSKDVIY